MKNGKTIVLLLLSISGTILLFTSLARWNESVNQTYLEHQEFQSHLPIESRPGGYVSSKSCQSCHLHEYQTWHETYHRTMTQQASFEAVVAEWNNIHLFDQDFGYHLVQEEDEYYVDIYFFPPGVKPDEKNIQTSARFEDRYRIGLTTGSHHMQVYWLSSDEGNMQKIFPFTWLIEDKRWVHRKDIFLRDPDLPMKMQLWNKSCYRCHSTAAQPRPNLTSGITHTRLAETGIGCEACHGPGSNHINLFSSPEKRYSRHLSTHSDSETKNELHIVNPENLDHVKSSQVCAQCHSVKWFKDGPELWEHGFTFQPGNNLNETTPVVRPTKIEEQTWLHPLLDKSPDILQRQFWPDGEVRVSGREFNGLVESACFEKGTLSCLSCHEMHGGKEFRNDQLKPFTSENDSCLKCHDSGYTDETHTFHEQGSSGSSCYNCHMPHTTYGLLKSIRSHEINSPSIQAQLDSGRPNACSLCHLDKPLGWVAENLSKNYGHSTPNLNEDMQTLPEALRLGLSGGPNQRALITWHLNWEPAMAHTQPTWRTALLMSLFEDRYSAVRYLAAEGLEGLSQKHLNKSLDYVASDSNRIMTLNSLRDVFRESHEEELEADPWLNPANPSLFLKTVYERLVSERPKKSVQLVE